MAPVARAGMIDLGVPGDHAGPPLPGGRALRIRVRRRLVAAALVLLCLVTVAGSAQRVAGLGEPLWTSDVGRNGFSLGASVLYQAAPAGSEMIVRDLMSGRRLWSLDRPDLDVNELPHRTMDLGGGVTAAVQSGAVRFLRADTGQQIGQLAGDLDGPSRPGLPVVVLGRRPATAAGCAGPRTHCVDLTGWQVSTATVAWRLSLPPGNVAVLTRPGRYVEGLLEQTADGTIRQRDLGSGAVVGQTPRPPPDAVPDQFGLAGDVMVTARREPEEIVLTAYRRPAFSLLWSVRVPAAKVIENVQLSGFYILDGCGAAMCLRVDGRTSQLVDLTTGSVTATLEAELAFALGEDLFIATPTSFRLPARGLAVYVVNRANRIVADYTGFGLVEWVDSGGRVMLAEPGPDRTGLVILDERGQARHLGSVAGTHLTCAARGDFLACSDDVGVLRVWRLPIQERRA